MSENQIEREPDTAETFLLGEHTFALKNNQLHNQRGEYLPLRSQAPF